MTLISFRHADRDLEFSISPITWEDQLLVSTTDPDPKLPSTSALDAGKFLTVDTNGKPIFTGVKPGAVDFNIVQYQVTGNKGSVAANFNSMPLPLVFHPSQLVFLHDQESGKTYIWTGGIGTFGYQGGGSTVADNQFLEIKPPPLNINFATNKEVADAKIEDKAVNPEGTKSIDVDGGMY